MGDRRCPIHRPDTPAPVFVNSFERFADDGRHNADPPFDLVDLSYLGEVGLGEQPLEPWEFSSDVEQLDNQWSLDWHSDPDGLSFSRDFSR